MLAQIVRAVWVADCHPAHNYFGSPVGLSYDGYIKTTPLRSQRRGDGGSGWDSQQAHPTCRS